MSPLAREELRRYCADAARVRKARQGWTSADWTDAIVAVVCFTGLVFLGGFGTAEYQHNSRAKACPTHLPDGRRLMTFHLTVDGPEKCVYEAPKADRKTGRV